MPCRDELILEAVFDELDIMSTVASFFNSRPFLLGVLDHSSESSEFEHRMMDSFEEFRAQLEGTISEILDRNGYTMQEFKEVLVGCSRNVELLVVSAMTSFPAFIELVRREAKLFERHATEYQDFI